MLLSAAKVGQREDPRVTRTRTLLTQAFFELLTEGGFHAITVQDIADRAQVNRATFYAHFEDKYALMKYLIADSFQQALSDKVKDDDATGPVSIALVVITVCEFMAQLEAHCHPTDKTLVALFETEITTQIAETLGGAAGDLAPTMMSWAIYGAARQWSQSDPHPSPADFAHQIMPVLRAMQAS